MMQLSHPVANTAVPRRHDDPLRRIDDGLCYLEAAQAPAASPWAGSWPATMHELRRTRLDYNCFTTCLVCICLAPLTTHPRLPLEMRTRARQLIQRSATFIGSCRAAASPGAYRFWRATDFPQPGPDLNDTALAHLALYAAGTGDALDPLDGLRLFAPYRARRGTALHPISLTLLRISAAQQCGIDPPESMRRWAYSQQGADGGWSAGRICCDRYGRLFWTSAAITTALALRTMSTTTE